MSQEPGRGLETTAFSASLVIFVRLSAEDYLGLEAPAMVTGAPLIACARSVNLGYIEIARLVIRMANNGVAPLE